MKQAIEVVSKNELREAINNSHDRYQAALVRIRDGFAHLDRSEIRRIADEALKEAK